jgi:hypothetical protein
VGEAKSRGSQSQRIADALLKKSSIPIQQGRLPRDLEAKMQVPIGTVRFRYTNNMAFTHGEHTGIILDVPGKGHFFRLERTTNRTLLLFHSSNGTGTRQASICLQSISDFDTAWLEIAWSPSDLSLKCQPIGIDQPALFASGTPSPTNFRVADNGLVFQFGDQNIEVMDTQFTIDGKRVLSPTAIESWSNTLKAIEILRSGKSTIGYLYEIIQGNAILSMLVTGLEIYSKTRLNEINTEGIPGDWNAVFNAFTPKKVRESGRLSEISQEAEKLGVPIFQAVLDELNINFQSIEKIKLAYKTSYGIRLGEIGINNLIIQKLRTFVEYRHRIVHVSPMITTLNGENVPPEHPIHANQALVDDAISCFDCVIKAIHQASLSLYEQIKPVSDSQQ